MATSDTKTLRALSAPVTGQAGRIEQSVLHEHAGLVPVNVLVRNLVAFEADDHRNGHFDGFAGWRHARQQPVNDRRMGETDEELIYDLILADGS